MVFTLPPVIVVVFISAFSQYGGSSLDIRVAAFDDLKSHASSKLLEAIRTERIWLKPINLVSSVDEIRYLVRRGPRMLGSCSEGLPHPGLTGANQMFC